MLCLCAVVGVVLISGCGFNDQSAKGSIEYSGQIAVENGTFVMEGELVNGGVQPTTFTNVRVHLYDADKTLLRTVPVGTINGRNVSVSITSDRIPTYVIIDSPEFWSTPRVAVQYYVREETGEYFPGQATDRDDLPVPPDHMSS
jgi:hypothetical protein